MTTQPEIQAVTILHVNQAGLVLAVSRKNDVDDFGMPGGKVDAGETPEQAAVRELFEETGLTATNLKPVFTSLCGPGKKDGKSFYTATFTADVTGEIDNDREAGVVAYVDREALLIRSCFAAYNRALFYFLGL